MRKNRTTRWNALMVLFLIFGLFTGIGSFATSAHAQTQYTVITSTDQLPVKGQLIIVPGRYFTPPPSWNGGNVTIWKGMADPDVSGPYNLGSGPTGLAYKRAMKYGGTAADYPTVIWQSTEPLNRTQTCDGVWDGQGDGLIINDKVHYGDEGCFQLVEYNSADFPQTFGAQGVQPQTPPVGIAPTAVAPAPTTAPAAPTAPPAASATIAPPTMAPPTVVQSTVAPKATVAPVPPVVAAATTDWSWLLWLLLLLFIILIFLGILRWISGRNNNPPQGGTPADRDDTVVVNNPPPAVPPANTTVVVSPTTPARRARR